MDVLQRVEDKLARGQRITDEEALGLFDVRSTARLGKLAHKERVRRHGNAVYTRTDLNVNHTNICAADCGFCAFFAKSGTEKAYLMTIDEIEQKATAAYRAGVNEWHVVGGLTPECDLAYFEQMFRMLKRVAPGTHIQGMTGVEVDFLAKREKISLAESLRRLRAAGLDSIPGGGAEVFHPEARKRMLATKIAGERFLDVHREAHAQGIPTNVSILYGHVETHEERIDHMRRIRELQDATGGFHAFVALAWNPENTELHAKTGALGPSAFDTLRFLSISRLYFDNLAHIKVPWVTVGKPLAQVSLSYGVDDIGGSAFEERILQAAGGKTWAFVKKDDLPSLIRSAGFEPVHTFGSYDPIPDSLVQERQQTQVVA
ncbi:MAG TPA: CofH family radical SAM protein [Candidatus Thermoplasmatota archaeon]|nr:CofH family radical SAM protein [Candidatus Thermoplasmatota archaeon]